MSALDVLTILFIVFALLPMLQRRRLEFQRLRFLQTWERRHKHRMIALIHRQETMSVFGFPLLRYIDIQDSEEVLRALRLTDADIPIDIVLHTPGGLALAAEQIAHAICRRTGKVTVYVPHYAMSGGTLIALAADEIVMDPNAVLGSLDPQLGQHPAVSIVRAVDWKVERRLEIDDETLILADIARKAVVQLRGCVRDILLPRLGEARAEELATRLTHGEWTHDHPLNVEMLRGLGLPINTDMPRDIYEYMRLFPQPGFGRPSVQYIPLPYRSPVPAPRTPVPRTRP